MFWFYSREHGSPRIAILYNKTNIITKFYNTIQYDAPASRLMFRRLVQPKQFSRFFSRSCYNGQKLVDEQYRNLRNAHLVSIYSSILVPVFVVTTAATTITAFELCLITNSNNITTVSALITGVTIGTIISITYPISYPLISFYTIYKLSPSVVVNIKTN